MMMLSVYIPCRNGVGTLTPVLQALAEQTRPADELLFIDDRSDDGSPDLAQRFGFRVIHQTGPRGLAAGRNLALRMARGRILAGIDADVRVEPDYCAELERAFTTHMGAVALCGRLTEAYTDTPADLWRAVHMRQHYGERALENPRFLFGSTMAVRRDVVRECGGWNERFVRNYEDVDLSDRLRAAGHELRYHPACRAVHLRRDSLESVLHGFWNWFLPKSELAGHYASSDSWARSRLRPVVWGIYRHRSKQDLDEGVGQLAAITLLLPWAMILYDLEKLGELPACAALPDLARAVAREFHAPGHCADWLSSTLSTWMAERARPTAERATDLCEQIRLAARESLDPAPDYWAAVAKSVEWLAAQKQNAAGSIF
jgi:glycosyltransferase involved in cell wall biosynthesis